MAALTPLRESLRVLIQMRARLANYRDSAAEVAMVDREIATVGFELARAELANAERKATRATPYAVRKGV